MRSDSRAAAVSVEATGGAPTRAERVLSILRSLRTDTRAQIADVEWALGVFDATVAKAYGGRTLHFATWGQNKDTFCGEEAFWRGGAQVNYSPENTYCATCVRIARTRAAARA